MTGYEFASDNASGICPEAWEALAKANSGAIASYGEDSYTETACRRLREVFETDCEVFFVFNGTAANSLALAHLCQSYHAVVCHEKAHLQTDECGAPAFFSGGLKLMRVGGELAKLTVDAVTESIGERRDLHFSKPKVLSLTQASEFGTVYALAEIKALSEAAKAEGMTVHMDGARFANAVAGLDCSPSEVTWRNGVDVLSFGLSKLGAGIGEAVVFFDKTLAQEFDYRCKQAGQLTSKMRFLAAPWCGLLKDDAWLKTAGHANERAKQLAQGLEALGFPPLFPVQANAVFVRFSKALDAFLHEKGWHYYSLVDGKDARLMCSWSTTEDVVERFLSDVSQGIEKVS